MDVPKYLGLSCMVDAGNTDHLVNREDGTGFRALSYACLLREHLSFRHLLTSIGSPQGREYSAGMGATKSINLLEMRPIAQVMWSFLPEVAHLCTWTTP